MEVILVDDGSPDRCPQLCDEWAQKDSSVRVIHQLNGGLSAARNAGIDIAAGQYITFVDSDDWLSPDTYASLLEQMDDLDLLEYSIAGRLQLSNRSYTNTNSYWLDAQAYTHTYAWNKIFRRELFNGVQFPEGRIFEDVYTLPLLLRKARKIGTTSHGSYHYTQNPQGITARADGGGLAQLLDAHLGSRMPIDDRYYMYLVNIQMDVREQTGLPIILPTRHVHLHQLSGKNKLKAVMLNLLGIKTLCKANKIIHRLMKPSRL